MEFSASLALHLPPYLAAVIVAAIAAAAAAILRKRLMVQRKPPGMDLENGTDANTNQIVAQGHPPELPDSSWKATNKTLN